MQQVYILCHKRVLEILDEEKVHETKLLGFFSSEEKCAKAIAYYITQPGFQKYPDDFEICTVEADVDEHNSIPGSFSSKVYYLSHEWYDGEYDYVTRIGYYSTPEKAEAAKCTLQNDPEFIDHPDGFCVDEYTVDEMEWKEGFCSLADMEEAKFI